MRREGEDRGDRGSGPRKWAVRLLLLLFPRTFRKRHGEEFERFLVRQRQEPRYGAPLLGFLRFWTEVGWDALGCALRVRMRNGVRREARRMRTVLTDVRGALRGLRRNKGFGLTVALTLGLGIGATTAVFSLANWALLRPVPGVSGHDRLVTVRFRYDGGRDGWFLASHPDFVDLRAGTPALDALAASHETDVHVAGLGGGTPRRLPAALVTADYFEALGVEIELGRAPSGGGDPREVVLSRALWQDAFGGDSGAIGTSLSVNGVPFTVVGVAATGFRGPAVPQQESDLWMPVEAHRVLLPNYPADVLSRRGRSLYFNLYGRLRDGAVPATAEAQLSAVRREIVEEHGDESSLDRFTPVLQEGVGVAPWTRDRMRVTLRILLGVVGVLLLLACANAGNLLLVRTSARSVELAVRSAMGASRGRILARLAAEGLLLGAAGGVVGMALARGGLWLFEGQRILPNFPPLHGVSLDGRVLGFALAVSLLTGCLFVVPPALVTAGRSTAALRSGARTSTGRHGLRTGLVVVQVALSVALVVGAGLLLDTVRSLQRVDLGFRPDGVLEATLDPGTQGYDDDEIVAFWRTLVRRARRLPGVEDAGLAWAPVQGSIASDDHVWPVGGDEDEAVTARSNYVGEGFVAALGLQLVAGRDFRAGEVMSEPSRDVVLVSESLAEALFAGARAVGRKVSLSYREGRAFEIVGVVADARLRRLKDENPRLLLEPFGQAWTPSWATLHLRSSGEPATLARGLRELVRGLDAGLPVYDVQPLERRVLGSMAEERMLARVTTLFAGLALLLAGVGLYGVMSYTVSSRTRELGVRISLGASASRIRRVVLGRALVMVGWGVGAGILLAAAVARLLSSRLWGVAPFDPVIFGLAVVALTTAAACATWLPAWRATRVDPVEALRREG